MSALEMDRMQVVQRVLEKRLTQAEAAMVLGLSQRQVRRLCQSMRRQGPRALVSRKRGRPSNRQLPEVVQEYAVGLISERYRDFGPTLAHEKLTELHGVRVSRETLRKWMIGAEIWTPRAQRGPRIHQPRRRRDCLGELVQIDGSDHEWFEGRGQRCTLLVFIDDATGRLMELRFVEVESAFDYFDATASYVRKHGKPAAFYSDKHSIFRVNQEGSTGAAKGVTQYGRALGELNIDIICANTAQAKGRVERMNKTLQDRLVKELRLHGISNAEDANAFVPAFMDAYNNRFERAPRSLHNAHRPLLEGEDLNLIFTWQEDRKLSQSLVVQFQRNSYLVEPTTETSKLAGKTVRVHLWKDGQVQLRHNNQPLSFALFDKSPHVNQGEIVENKRLGTALAVIQQQQQVRDEARLRSKKLTLRQKERLRAQRAEAESAGPTPTGINPGAAEAFASYLQEFDREQKAKQRRYTEAARARRAAAREASQNCLDRGTNGAA